jgi:DNA-directed RNA polymerase subunit alpha
LERGFGHTIGNAMRRALLSYIPGYAITQVKFDKVPHEYVTNTNIEEDMVDVLLNLKKVAIKLHDGKEQGEVSLHVKASKKGQVVTAGDIKTGADSEIANPEQVIAHLVQGGEINATMKVEYGRGYRSADKRLGELGPKSIGTLALDASFSPIHQVAYRVESARLGNRADLDCLILDLETNGTIDPEAATRRAATILWQHFQPFIEEDAGSGRVKNMEKGEEMKPMLLLDIDNLSEQGVSARTISALKKADVHQVGDLVRLEQRELLLMPNIGKSSIEEIKHCLLSMDLDLGQSIPNWPGVATGEAKA